MADVAMGTFLSQDRPITGEVFRSASAPQPTLLLVHGAGGTMVRHKWYRHLATLLAEKGFAVWFVHYFESTGTGVADREVAHQHYWRWNQTLVDAVSFISRQPNVITDRIGVIGLSLGGTLALTVAAQAPKVGAVALFFCEIPKVVLPYIHSLPPALVVHGKGDQWIPVAQAYRLKRWLQRRNMPCELKIYSGEGHVFRDETVDDAMEAAAVFFKKYLRPDWPANRALRT